MGYGSESILIGAIVTALAAAASTTASLYGASETQKAQDAAATRAANQSADNQLEANRAAESYRQQQEQLRQQAYQKAEDERGRQKELQSEADAQLKKSQSEASIAKQLQLRNEQEAKLGKDYGQVAETATPIPGVATGAEAADEAGTRVVAAGYKDALKKVSAFLGGKAKGQAKLDAITNAGLIDALSQNRNQQNLNRITNFMQGSAAVLPAELQATNTARQLVDKTAAENMALFGDNQARINAAAVNDVTAAQNIRGGYDSIAALLGTTGQIGATYAGNAAGQPPKAQPVKKAKTKIG